jgi:hypothetical protein
LATYDVLLEAMRAWARDVADLPDTHALITTRDTGLSGPPPPNGPFIHLDLRGPRMIGTPRRTIVAIDPPPAPPAPPNVEVWSQGAEYYVTFNAFRDGAEDIIARIMLLADSAPWDIEFLTAEAQNISGLDQTTFETRFVVEARLCVRLETTVAAGPGVQTVNGNVQLRATPTSGALNTQFEVTKP